ncbi:MAG: AAA family ATPase [Burkholderiales bacterium]|nr:AAA family ATPase [Burkholderiales bacterium]
MSDGSAKVWPGEDFKMDSLESEETPECKDTVKDDQETTADSSPEPGAEPEAATPSCPANHIYVLDPIAVRRMTNPVTARQRGETQTRLRDLLLQHQHLASPYPLRPYPADMAQRWKKLRSKFPNFSEVLDLLEKRYALALLRRDTPVSFPPLLLLGDPGVGKTAFSKALSKEIGLFYGEIQMSGLTEAFTISGLDVGWSSGNPGRVFEYVSAARHANPLLLLDEFDKCSQGGSGGDPHAPFHVLLERHSAQHFEDMAIRLPADMRWINWVATANEPLAIPASLLSRFRRIVVPKPSRTQMTAVINSVYEEKRDSVTNGDLFARKLDQSIVELLLDLTPRAVGLVIEEAMGACAKRSRRGRLLRITPGDVFLPKSHEQRRIGFFPN